MSRSSTTAGSQRSGTRSTSGIALSAARATLTTEHVAEAEKNTLGIFGKKQQRTLARTAATKASERYLTKKPSEVHNTRRCKPKHKKNFKLSTRRSRQWETTNTQRSTENSWKRMQKNFERSTTDNRSFALQIESKQNWTEREETRIKIVEKGAKRCQKISGTKKIRATTTTGRTQRVDRS